MTTFFSDVFARDYHRCIFCGRDLMTDFESFILAQEDHLVPLAKGGTDSKENIVIACYPCNKLKGKYVPEFQLTETNRTKYINAVRDEIMMRRSKNMRDFASWTHDEPGASLPAP